MTRHRDARGNLYVLRGRTASRPFGSISDWPGAAQARLDMQAAESLRAEQRTAYRQWSASSPAAAAVLGGDSPTSGAV